MSYDIRDNGEEKLEHWNHLEMVWVVFLPQLFV